MSTHSKTRARLLTGVGTSVLASLIAGGSFAAETTIPDFANAVALGHKVEVASVANSAAIGAVASGNVGGITVTGTQAGTSNTVTANIIEAVSNANNFANSIDMALIGADPVDGLAALGVAQNSGIVTATAADNALRVDLTGFASGTAVNDGNTIRAATNVNTGSTTIAGDLPNGYTSTTAGTSSFNTDTVGPPVVDAVNAEGSVVATSVQLNVATSTATVEDNAIGLSLSADTANSVDSSPSLSTNTVAAAATVNSATTAIGLGSADAPAFAGSAVASNLQSNSGAATAENLGSQIVADITGTDPATSVNTLDGGLAVANNTVSSAVTGNRAVGSNGTSGIALTIGDQLSVDGPTAAATAGASFAYDAGNLAGVASADLVVLNTQGNNGGDLEAVTSEATIVGDVQSISAGTVSIASNMVSSQATGNIATAALKNGADAASFDASVAMVSQQVNNGADVSAATVDVVVAAITGNTGAGGQTTDSTVTSTGNTIAATAYGNSAAQSVALESNTLNQTAALTSLTGGTLGATDDGNVSATGMATVTNLQANYSSDVTAVQLGTQVGVVADTRIATPDDVISGSTLSATGNRQEAVALGSSGSNALSLTGNSVGSGVGVANVQIGGAGADVTAALGVARAGVVAGTHVVDSSVTTSNTVQRAIGYGTSATNSLAVDGNTVTAAMAGTGSSIEVEAGSSAPFHDPQPVVSSAFGLLNDQSILGSVTADVFQVEVGTTVEGRLASSSAATTANGIVGAAYGTDAANTLSVAAGTLSAVVDPGSIGQLTSTQAVAGADSAVASSAYARVTTDIEDEVTNSTVTTSTNQIQATSTANRVTNGMTVAANTLETRSSPSVNTDPNGGDDLLNNTAFGVTSAQYATGTVAATLLDNLNDSTVTPSDSARVLTSLGTDVATITGSTVASNTNQLSAAATGNSAANSIAGEGNSITTTMGVQNFQESDAVLQATLGLAGLPGSPGGPFNYTVVGDGIVYDPGTRSLTAGELVIDATGLSSAEIDYLEGQGWTYNGGSDELRRSAVGVTSVEGQAVDGELTDDLNDPAIGVAGNAVAPDFPGSPNIGGVSILAAGASVEGSALSVDTNSISGSVTGNTASNALSIDAGSILANSGFEGATVSAAIDGETITSVDADYSVSNAQTVTTTETLTSQVYGTFSVETADDAAITGSTLSVSDNSQRSVAVANTAANALSNSVALTANTVDATSALVSIQNSTAGLSALSDSDILAPAAVTGSTVDMSGNTNTALAVMNDVANSSNVAATTIATTNLVPAGEVREAALVTGEFDTAAARGDHVVANIQTAGAVAISSTAATSIFNLDQLATATSGITASTVTLMDNATYGEASANRATNSLTLNGATLQGANAGLSNTQSSAAAVSSNASSVVGVSLTGDVAAPAASASTVAIDGNSTTALARGNYASNVLNSEAGAAHATSTAGGRVDTGSFAPGIVSDATVAMLNTQTNSGAINAVSDRTSYGVTLNNAATPLTSTGLTGSSLSVAGNSVGVEALGNSASNVLRVTGLNTGSPTAALGSFQTNSGAITATASAATIGATGYGLATSSSLGVSSNTISARATGNSVTNAIARVTR